MHQQGHVLTSGDNPAAWSGVVSGSAVADHGADKKEAGAGVGSWPAFRMEFSEPECLITLDH